MRRVLTVLGAVAAIAAFSNRAMAAHTQAEIHMFFGTPVVDGVGVIPASPSAAELITNPTTPVVAGLAHTLVYPIWLRVLPGDFPTNSLTALAFRVYGSGLTTNVSNSANSDNPLWNPGSALTPSGAGNGAALPSDATLKQLRSGFFNQKGGSDSNAGPGTYFLGTMTVSVAAGATNESVNLFFVTGTDIAGQNIASTGTGTNATVAFGANPAAAGQGFLDTFRRDNTNNDVQGSGQASLLSDATITVIPEPMTIGLLALGLLGIRRRQVV